MVKSSAISSAVAEDTKKQLYINTIRIETMLEAQAGLEEKIESTSARLGKIEKIGYMIAGAFFLLNAGPGLLNQANTWIHPPADPDPVARGIPHAEGHYGPWPTVAQTPKDVVAAIPVNSTAITTVDARGNKVTYYAMRQGEGPR